MTSYHVIHEYDVISRDSGLQITLLMASYHVTKDVKSHDLKSHIKLLMKKDFVSDHVIKDVTSRYS